MTIVKKIFIMIQIKKFGKVIMAVVSIVLLLFDV